MMLSARGRSSAGGHWTGGQADLKSGLSDYETADGDVLGPPAVRVRQRQLENCKLQNLQCQKTEKKLSASLF